MTNSTAAKSGQPTPVPDPSLVESVARFVAEARARRWRYDESLDAATLAHWISRQASEPNTLADVSAALRAGPRLLAEMLDGAQKQIAHLERELSRAREDLDLANLDKQALIRDRQKAQAERDKALQDTRTAIQLRRTSDDLLAALRTDLDVLIADIAQTTVDSGGLDRDAILARLRTLVAAPTELPSQSEKQRAAEWASLQVGQLIAGLARRRVNADGYFARPAACALDEIDRLRAELADVTCDHTPLVQLRTEVLSVADEVSSRHKPCDGEACHRIHRWGDRVIKGIPFECCPCAATNPCMEQRAVARLRAALGSTPTTAQTPGGCDGQC